MYYLTRRARWPGVHISIWKYSPETGTRKTVMLHKCKILKEPENSWNTIRDYCDGIPFEYIERDCIYTTDSYDMALFELLVCKMEEEERVLSS